MPDLISWPIGPVQGDSYTVNGKYWEYNGCAWISTCCPGICSIYNTGIVVGITKRVDWGPIAGPSSKKDITTQICFTYDEQTGTWNSDSLNDRGDYYQLIETTPGVWQLNLMILGLLDTTYAELTAETPIGLWDIDPKVIKKVGINKIESICGCPAIICGCAKDSPENPCSFYTFFPVSDTGVSGSIIGYQSLDHTVYVYYNTTDNRWELYDNADTDPSYTISFPITTIPIGDWVPGQSATPFNTKYAYFSTTLGHCNPCNPYTDGIILAYNVDGVITYVPLTWNSGSQRFENFDATIYVEYNPATDEWNLWINGTLVYGHKGDLLGYWSKEITILCGNTSITNTEGCLSANTVGGQPATLYLQENTNGDFNYGYPFSEPTWQIICDTGVWEVQRWNSGIGGWDIVATVTASCATPPYSLSWTIVDETYSSVIFVEGPCPIVCNSYTFNARGQERARIDFKLCGCDQMFFIEAPLNGTTDTYCVQEDSIHLGAFGNKNLVSAPCTPNPTQCYTMYIRTNEAGATFNYIDCNGDTNYVTLNNETGLGIAVCGIPCSINTTTGVLSIRIDGLGCNL